jgi:hypothetical protein
VVMLKAYDFFFRRERVDFVPDPNYVPYFWRRNDDGSEDAGAGKEKGSAGSSGPSRVSGSKATNMDIDTSQASGANHGKSVENVSYSPMLLPVSITPYHYYYTEIGGVGRLKNCFLWEMHLGSRDRMLSDHGPTRTGQLGGQVCISDRICYYRRNMAQCLVRPLWPHSMGRPVRSRLMPNDLDRKRRGPTAICLRWQHASIKSGLGGQVQVSSSCVTFSVVVV